MRAPNSVAKYFYQSDPAIEEDTTINDDVEVAEINRIDSKVLKSYPTYKPIDLIYKFFEKLSYRRLEQRFHHRFEFDIAKCFYNIYTHSITWAIKGKEYAKQNHKHTSFETQFDNIVQLSNYNETNGIIVGPEFSRIFAEVILQAIDLQVHTKLEEQGFKYKVDYNIKRYVDDYFVFTNDLKLGEIIQKLFKDNLEEYKLYINERKSIVRERPFMTNIGVGKIELKDESQIYSIIL
ncbi:MAG: RNA-directed DNA polymerase [Saprospiraceae bacterium]|nr:RNA-directed DNA polymerase [Saprospiraceae bacterium]